MLAFWNSSPGAAPACWRLKRARILVNVAHGKAYRDTILGHSLKGMDTHYIKPPEASLTAAMEKYTEWLDAQVEAKLQNVDHFVDQAANMGGN